MAEQAEETDQTEEAEEKKAPPKRGLHGWKAAFAIFGCGSLAAFGVFGVLIGIASTFLNVASSGVGESEGNGDSTEGIGQARSSLGEGEMDVCTDNLDQLSGINVSRQDDGQNYVDTEVGGNVNIPGASRTVEDECFWSLTPSQGSTPWDFYFSYEAVIDSSGGTSPEEIAEERFEEASSGLAGELREIESEGDSDLAPEAYSVYGIDDSGNHAYAVVSRSKSAVYQIHFTQQADVAVREVSENEFMNEARDVSSFLNSGFEYWIPDE